MKLRFLGGVDEIGSLSMVAEVDGHNILFEHGLTPTKPPKYPIDPPNVERVFITHAHLDHSGMIPFIAARSAPPITCTPMTAALVDILINDTLVIEKNEGYKLPYDKNDFRTAKELIDPIDYDASRRVGNQEVFFHPAGHIPGSTMFEMGHGGGTMLFTGDINTINTQLLGGCKPVKCDTLVVEATYAGKEHQPRDEIEKALRDKVDDIAKRGGLAVIPAFAVGRSQEVLLALERSGANVWVDGMSNTVTKIMLRYPQYLRAPNKLRKLFNNVNKVQSPEARERAFKGSVVITTSGMMDGGPVLRYMNRIKNDPKSAVLLTGYQVEGTNGRKLLDTGLLELEGKPTKLDCEVAFFDLSAHCGHTELKDFIRGCEPTDVVLCHGDNRQALKDELKEEFTVHLPKVNETLELN